MFNRSNVIWSMVSLVVLTASAAAQDVTYDNLTLDDGSGSTPVLTMLSGSSDEFNYRLIAFNSGLGFYLPGQALPTIWMYDEAPPTSLYLDDLGVGIGTQSPFAPLHLRGNGAVSTNSPFPNPWIWVQDTSSTKSLRNLVLLSNNGGSSVDFENTNTGTSWQFAQTNSGSFRVSLLGSGGNEFQIRQDGRLTAGPGGTVNMDLRSNGNLIIAGTLTQSSDRNVKENFEVVDHQQVLEQLSAIPLTTWNFKSDDDEIRHMGPVAQDFHAAFNLGMNDTTLAPVDGIGVSLAAIQALHENIRELRDKVAEQEKQLRSREQQLRDLSGDFEKRIQRLESALLQGK